MYLIHFVVLIKFAHISWFTSTSVPIRWRTDLDRILSLISDSTSIKGAERIERLVRVGRAGNCELRNFVPGDVDRKATGSLGSITQLGYVLWAVVPLLEVLNDHGAPVKSSGHPLDVSLGIIHWISRTRPTCFGQPGESSRRHSGVLYRN